MLSLECITKLLGIKEAIPLTPSEMAKSIKVTFHPVVYGSAEVQKFAKDIEAAMRSVGVTILPYEEATTSSNSKEKVRKGIVTFVVGEREGMDLPIRHVMTSTDNPIVTIIDMPDEVREGLSSGFSYKKHMDIGLNLFTWHMCQVAICVDKNSWIIYSFNGFSEFYKRNTGFEGNVLNNFIPKVATRVKPLKISEFKVQLKKRSFVYENSARPLIKDLTDCDILFSRTRLFSVAKRIDELRYKGKIYKKIASMHLDERKGMSYGFIARQFPIKLPNLIPLGKKRHNLNFGDKDWLIKKNKSFVKIEIPEGTFALEIPPVWVLMTRSGCDKTELDPNFDIIKIGMINREFVMEIPPNINLNDDYRPSFDTRLIFSHCLASVVYGSILKKLRKEALYPKMIENSGLAITHWHGDYLPTLPPGWYVYGKDSPPVLCSSPQSAIYAFRGKEQAVLQSLRSETPFLGDVHIEPQHGLNITWKTLKDLVTYLLNDQLSTWQKNISSDKDEDLFRS